MFEDFPGGSAYKESICNAGDLDLIPGLERSPGEGNGTPPRFYYLGNPKDGGSWGATVHWVTRVGHNLVTKPPPIDTACLIWDISFVLPLDWDLQYHLP